jgi:cell division septation protein DedD
MKFTVVSSLFVAAVFGATASAQTTPSAPRSAIGWPPRLEVGQVWAVTLGKRSFNVTLNTKDSDGDPAGVATDGDKASYRVFFYFNAKDGLADLYLQNARQSYRCLFSSGSISKDNPNDVTMIGAGFLFNASAPVATDRFVQQQEPCIATWTNAPSAPASIQTANPAAPSSPVASAPSSPAPASPTPPTPTPAVTPPSATPPAAPLSTAAAPARVPSAPLALTWPPKIQSGQGWYLTIGNSGYDINLTQVGANGIGRGTTTSGTAKLETYFYFVSNENRLVMELVAQTYTLTCSFTVRGAEDKVLNGEASTKIGNNSPQSLRDRCALYLVTAPAGSALLTQPLL